MLQQKTIGQDESCFISEGIELVKEPTSEKLISIIIPLFNEEKSIKKVIQKINTNFLTEIIVVDDGSSDNSVKKVQEIKNKNIKIIRHKINMGYGAAILTGIRNSTGEVIITIDSDGQHDPKEIPMLIQPILDNVSDIVIGSRYKGKSNYRVPLHTRAGEFVVKKSLWYLFRQTVGNNQSGFRAFKRNALVLFEDVIFSKFGLCTEILFKAALKGYKISEVPISINKREHGASYNKIFEIFKSICTIILLYFLKKIRIGNIIPKQIWTRIYNDVICRVKKFY